MRGGGGGKGGVKTGEATADQKRGIMSCIFVLGSLFELLCRMDNACVCEGCVAGGLMRPAPCAAGCQMLDNILLAS